MLYYKQYKTGNYKTKRRVYRMIIEIEKELPTLKEPIRLKVNVYDSSLEMKNLDSRDFTYYGYSSIQELEESNDKETYLKIFQELYYSLEVVEGGRLDVLLRTSLRVLRNMARLKVIDEGEDSLLQLIYNELVELEEGDFDTLEEFKSVDEAMGFLYDW